MYLACKLLKVYFFRHWTDSLHNACQAGRSLAISDGNNKNQFRNSKPLKSTFQVCRPKTYERDFQPTTFSPCDVLFCINKATVFGPREVYWAQLYVRFESATLENTPVKFHLKLLRQTRGKRPTECMQPDSQQPDSRGPWSISVNDHPLHPRSSYTDLHGQSVST